MDFLKAVTKLLNYDQHNLVSTTRILRNSIEISENTYLDTFIPSVNKEVCGQFAGWFY